MRRLLAAAALSGAALVAAAPANLVLLDPADPRYTGSSCLDGTKYGMYYRPGAAPNADKWVRAAVARAAGGRGGADRVATQRAHHRRALLRS